MWGMLPISRPCVRQNDDDWEKACGRETINQKVMGRTKSFFDHAPVLEYWLVAAVREQMLYLRF